MDKNPFNICTLNSNSNCNECKNQNKLDCKLDKHQQKVSMLVIFSSLIIGSFGLILTGLITDNWLILIFYMIFSLLFFVVIENKVTCSHCPYYAEKTLRLNCSGNNIFPKIWKYNPKPINRYEKLVSILGIALIGLIPIISQIYSIWFFLLNNPNATWIMIIALIGLLLATILSFLMFFFLFLFTLCPRCINFSCQFNRVPKELVDEYLKKNPVIKKAWEKRNITNGKG